jgi:hypothetical protein
MAKVTLGKAPKSFKKVVDIVTLSGALDQIEVNYIYRTRSQFADLIDEKLSSAEAAAKAALSASEATDAAADSAKHTVGTAVAEEPKPAALKISDYYAKTDQAGADFVLKIADGWDLDDPFNEKTLRQLEDENPGALAAITAMYRQSVAEARVKN